ncbi:MAG: carboxypeptidase-like regulatory domain-containing protein [Methylotenera sp.]|nr:carboxypeptidase-like regulatory domain-containing protein [Methylotenera sp.]
MKVIGFITTLAIAVFGLLPTSALSSTSELESKLETVGNITYISGGVGKSAAEAMRSVAKDYALEIVFVQKQGQIEEFLAEVNVQIQDAQKNVVLDAVTDGPYLLANLPQGRYLVIAEYEGSVKRQWVRIGIKQHKKIVFWWPVPIVDSP